MKKTLAALSLLAFLPCAWSAERYQVVESVMLDTSADQAWELVRHFDALDTWHPAVTKTEIVEGEVPLRGAIRRLTIGDGEGTIRETLTDYSDADMQLSYVINSTDIMPVKDYASTINVVAISDALSLVIWSADFLANPPEGQPDSAARDTMVGVLRAGLDNLPSLLTGQGEQPVEQPQAEETQPQAQEAQPQTEETQPQAQEAQPQTEEAAPESSEQTTQ